MILIVDEDRRKMARCLRDSLWNYGIPSAVTDCDHIERFPEALCVMVFAGSEEYLNTVSLRCHRIPLLAVNESQSRIYNKDVLFYDGTLHDSYKDFLISFLYDRYVFLPGEFGCGDVLIRGADVLVGYVYLKFTKTERRILALLIMCEGKWVSSDTVRSACFENTGKGATSRIAVHICNINKKIFCRVRKESYTYKERDRLYAGPGYMKRFNIVSLIVAVSLTAAVLILRFGTGDGEGITTSDLRITGLKNGIGVDSGETIGGIFVSIPDGYTADDLISVSSDTDVAYLKVNKDNIFGDGTVSAELVGVSAGIAEVCLRIDDVFTEKYSVNVVGTATERAVSETDTAEFDGDGVYITATGTKYHLKRSCAGDGATETKLEDAVNGGYMPCKVCAMGQEKE